MCIFNRGYTLRTLLDAKPQWRAPPGGCKTHQRKRGREGGGKGGKGEQTETKVQRGDIDGKVKGVGRGAQGKRREEVRSQVWQIQELGNKRKEGTGGDVSQVQKKIRQKVRSRKVQVRREEFGEEELGFDCLTMQLSAVVKSKRACNWQLALWQELWDFYWKFKRETTS